MHAPSRRAIYAAIDRERAYQDAKYGAAPRPLGTFMVVLEEELAEARRAFVRADENNTLRELLQVAAVAVAAIEAHHLVER